MNHRHFIRAESYNSHVKNLTDWVSTRQCQERRATFSDEGEGKTTRQHDTKLNLFKLSNFFFLFFLNGGGNWEENKWFGSKLHLSETLKLFFYAISLTSSSPPLLYSSEKSYTACITLNFLSPLFFFLCLKSAILEVQRHKSTNPTSVFCSFP